MKYIYGSLLLIVGIIISGNFLFSKHSIRTLSSTHDNILPEIDAAQSYFLSHVKPIFDNRCVACHACEAAPCQLKLDSYEGLDRGATTAYPKAIKLEEQPQTRIFKDAKTTQGWREKGFWPIVSHDASLSSDELLEKSLLYRYVSHGKKQYSSGKLKEIPPRDFKQCVETVEAFDDDLIDEENHHIGMPFGAPALGDREFEIIENWISMGAPGPTKAEQKKLKTATHRKMIDKWEAFLNEKTNKHAWSAKYLYEHLYLAHFHFADNPGEFFELQRSRVDAPYGTSDEIVTKFPHDEIKERFEYRFNKIHSTIAHKVHIVYEVNDKTLERLKELFIDSSWGDKNITKISFKEKNPFSNFIQIPAKIRYRFLIENSRLLMDFFTRGPVCSGGTVATWVIQDHSWAMFEDPEFDISVNDPEYFTKVKKHLVVPDMQGFNIDKAWGYYIRNTERYEEAHAKLVAQAYPEGRGLNHIWDGDGDNPNALLTLYRHAGYSVTVHQGQVGEIPKVFGLINYPIFERIYYDLVAGFNIYGSLKHKLNSRLMITQLRRELEDNYLSLLPKELRRVERKKWYKDNKEKSKEYHFEKHLSQVAVENKDDAAKSLVQKIINQRLKNVAGPIDPINGHARLTSSLSKTSKITDIKSLDENLQSIAGVTGAFPQHFPETSYFRFIQDNGKSVYYSVIRNRAHHSIRYLMKEKKLLDHKNTTLNILRDVPFPFPLQFFTIRMKEAREFINQIESINSLEDYKKLEAEYGILKGDKGFWDYYDDLNEYIRQKDPVNAGVLDLNRYGIHHFPDYKF